MEALGSRYYAYPDNCRVFVGGRKDGSSLYIGAIVRYGKLYLNDS